MHISRETKLIPNILLCIIAFYVLPYLVATNDKLIAVSLIKQIELILVNSLIVFCGSYLSGRLCGFVWYLPFLTGLLFTPAMFIFYDKSYYIYIAIYFLFSFLGCFFGANMRKQKIRNKELKMSAEKAEKEKAKAQQDKAETIAKAYSDRKKMEEKINALETKEEPISSVESEETDSTN